MYGVERTEDEDQGMRAVLVVDKTQVPGDIGIYVVTAVLKRPSYVIQSTE